MALAFYRKYRPKSFADLVGHPTTVEVLTNAAKSGKLGHAYLFYGSRGTGKTTTARLIAKLFNCEKRAENPKFRGKGEPCNACGACAAIDAGSSFDVIEIDAASNRGIDEIRNLKESVKAGPAAGRHKVYIIDEAHMLTGAAFNALLKTLEEPPAHAVFILATTEYEKVPATIASRTQRFVFRKIPKVMIMERLEAIAGEENMKISEEALELIAAAGEGSLRDAISLLDQLSSLGEDLDLATAERLIGRTGLARIEELAKLILSGDSQGAIRMIADANEEGYNLVQLAKDLIHYLRKALTLKLDPALEKTYALDLTKDELERMRSLFELIEPEKTAGLIRSLIRAYGEMRYSPFASVPLEMALIESK